MGHIREVELVLPIAAAFSNDDSALEWSANRLSERWGAIALTSSCFDFVETDYYEPTMGKGIKKRFWALRPLADPGGLAGWKLASNEWEDEYARSHARAAQRPLNIDPGYITLAKLVLASTKDHAHRIYLGDGIYAEVTLTYRDKAWRAFEWTFPDYRRADYQSFFTECRELLHAELRRR